MIEPYTDKDYIGFSNLKVMERVYIKIALNETGGHRPKAAIKLGITTQLLNYKLKKHGLKIPTWRNN